MYKKYNKYKNKKTVVDGIKFDSMKEAGRYSELVLLHNMGMIKDLELQPEFELCAGIMWNGKKLRARKYRADFMYTDTVTGNVVVEDVKGAITQLYSLKRSIFLNLYPEYTFIET